MKKLNTLHTATGKTNWLGLCALTLLPLSAEDAFAAISCPSGQYANGSGGCTVGDGYSPTDQGSVAQLHLDTYYSNKSSFTHYQQQWAEFNKKNLQLIERLNKPLIRQYQILAARLVKWHREDTQSFVDYFKQVKTTIPLDLASDIPNDLSTDTHRNFMMGFVTDAYIEKSNDFLIGQYNANLRTVAGLYFQMNPTIMKSISIDYWTKAYAPGTSRKWGFTNSYSDSVSLGDVRSFYPFIQAAGERDRDLQIKFPSFAPPADKSDYDFSQIEEHFSDRWNNANTSPSANTAKIIKYYKFVPQPLPKSFSKSLTEKIDQQIIDQVNGETLAKTRSQVVGFKFNRLMSTYLAANQSKEELLSKSINQSLAFPKTENITQVTRVINQAKGTCLVPDDSRVQAGKIDLQHNLGTAGCTSAKRSMDWYVIENEDKTIQLKNAFSGQCLTTPRQAYEVPMTLICGGRVNTFEPASQYWQWTGDQRLRRSGMNYLYSLTLFEPSANPYIADQIKTLDVFPYDRLPKKDAARAKWSINTGYRRAEMLNPQNYKTADQLSQNFFALMYGFTEELPLMNRMKTVNEGSSLPVEDLNSRRLTDEYTSQDKAVNFFNQLYANHSLYNELPPSLKRFTTALRSGTSLLDAYSQNALAIYDDIKKTFTFKPTIWNDPNNKKGSLQIYQSPTGDRVDVFASKFDGNPINSNRPLPTNKKSNDHWTYVASLGSQAQVNKTVDTISAHFSESGAMANYGDIFRYNNPRSRKWEFFQAKFKGATNGNTANFPINQTSNDQWFYLGSQESAAVIVAALANDINTAYLSYMYSLIKLNIGTRHSIANIEQRLFAGNEADGFDFNNWTLSAAGPSDDISGQPTLGQYFYVSSPAVTGISLNFSNIGAFAAISDAVVAMIPNRFHSPQGGLYLQRLLMRQQFEDMFNPKYNQILRQEGLSELEVPVDQQRMYSYPPNNIYRDWMEGRNDPPENFQAFGTRLRALFDEGVSGEIDFRLFLDRTGEDGALPYAVQDGLLALDNSSLSSAFNALTVTESTLVVSTVTVNSLLTTLVGVGL